MLLSQGSVHEAAARGNPLGVFLAERNSILTQKTISFDGSVPGQYIEKEDLEKLFILLKNNFIHPQTLKLVSLFHFISLLFSEEYSSHFHATIHRERN